MNYLHQTHSIHQENHHMSAHDLHLSYSYQSFDLVQSENQLEVQEYQTVELSFLSMYRCFPYVHQSLTLLFLNFQLKHHQYMMMCSGKEDTSQLVASLHMRNKTKESDPLGAAPPQEQIADL
uniref:Uncharacterized protein n=1 Tax=Arundo donax TaxID=35708 RepID=A0A0A9CUR8_ARUDO